MKQDENFEWNTEEEAWGTRPQAILEEPVSKRPRWFPYLLFVLVLALILAVGFGLQRLGRRAQENTDAIRASILSVHHLVRQVTSSEDVDIFQTLATSKDRNWKETQLQLLYQGVYNNRASMGLWLDTAVSPISTPSETQVFLSPDLQTAEVNELLPYIVDFGDGVDSQVLLERTFTYERDVSEGNWILAPPDDADSYWGDWQREEGEFVRLVFPSRDEEISSRMAGELDTIAGEICKDSLVHCPDEVVLQLKLDKEPRSLLALRFNFPRLIRSSFDDKLYNLSLPAPSLVGLPVDEAGYQALYQGYSGWIAAAIINTFTDRLTIPFDFLSQKLRQIGLHPPPNPDYQPSLIAELSPIPFPNQDIQLLCIDDPDGFMNGHLMRYDFLNSKWLDETPKELLSMKFSSQSLLPLEGDSGVILSTRRVEAGTITSQLSLWRNGELEQLIETENDIYLLPFFSPKISVDEQYIPIIILGREIESGPGLHDFWLLDINSCDSKDCDMEQFSGIPVWSPDRSFGLLSPVFQIDEAPLALFQSSTKSISPIEMGFSPFWIDEKTFGYMRVFYSEKDEMPEKIDVVISTLSRNGEGAVETFRAGEPKMVLESEIVLEALPDYKRSELLFIIDVVASPIHPGMLFFKAIPVENDGEGDEIHLFSFEYPEGTVSYLQSLPVREAGYALNITRNGRYLTMIGQENVDSPGASSVSDNLFLVYDIEKDKINEFVFKSSPDYGIYSPDWSADEEWLVLTEEGMLRLAAPGYDYEKQILHSLSGCALAVWVNR